MKDLSVNIEAFSLLDQVVLSTRMYCNFRAVIGDVFSFIFNCPKHRKKKQKRKKSTTSQN